MKCSSKTYVMLTFNVKMCLLVKMFGNLATS